MFDNPQLIQRFCLICGATASLFGSVYVDLNAVQKLHHCICMQYLDLVKYVYDNQCSEQSPSLLSYNMLSYLY